MPAKFGQRLFPRSSVILFTEWQNDSRVGGRNKLVQCPTALLTRHQRRNNCKQFCMGSSWPQIHGCLFVQPWKYYYLLTYLLTYLFSNYMSWQKSYCNAELAISSLEMGLGVASGSGRGQCQWACQLDTICIIISNWWKSVRNSKQLINRTIQFSDFYRKQ